MALIFIDSFDHYTAADIGLKWSALGGIDPNFNFTIDIGGGRRGGSALLIGGNNRTVTKNLAGIQTVIVGFAMHYGIDPPANNTTPFLQILGADAPHLYVAVGADESLQVYRMSAVSGGAPVLVGASIPGALTWAMVQNDGDALGDPDTYNYIEVKATISAASAGAVTVRVNGNVVIDVHGVRTNATGSSAELATGILLRNGGNMANGAATYFDDLYICDTNGTANHDFLGDVAIDALVPAADGSYRQFTPSGGSAHYPLVNQFAASTTNYVFSSTVGARDSYQFADLPADYYGDPFGPGAPARTGHEVLGVQLVSAARNDVAGTRAIAHLAKSGVSELTSAPISLATARGLYTTILETDPATGAGWTEAALDAAEFGVVVAL